MIGEHVVPGVTTEALRCICHDYIVDVQQAIPANVNLSRLSEDPSAPPSITLVCPWHPER